MTVSAFPLRVYDPATDQWYDICGGPAGPEGPRGPEGPAGHDGHDGSLPDGVLGDLLWYNGTSWVGLPASGDLGDVLTLTVSGGDLIPLYEPIPPLPSPGSDAIICGMARFLGEKLTDAFTWYRSEYIQAGNLYLANLSAGITGLDTIVSVYFPVVGFVGGLLGALTTATAALDIAHSQANFAPLTPGQIEDGIVASFYCGMQASTGTGAVDASTLAAVVSQMDAYPNWRLGTDDVPYQKLVLENLLTAIPLEQWALWATRGAAAPSNSCSGLCGE